MRTRLAQPRFVLLAILLIAFALRVLQLDYQPLWWDEGYSVFFATRDFFTMLARTAVDIHPPLYYALLQIWIALAGKTDLALRIFSVAVGVATVPLIYFVGKEIARSPDASPTLPLSTEDGERVGVLAALLLAISPLHIYYSQEVRMYGLVTLLALASIALQMLLLKVGEVKPARGRWLAYIIVTAAALYTQYFAAFVLVAQMLVVLHSKDRKRESFTLRAWIIAWFAIFILYLPWLIYAGPKLYAYVTSKVGIEQYSRLDPATFFAQHLVTFSTGHLNTVTWLGWGALLFFALAVVGIRRQATEERRQRTDDTRQTTDSRQRTAARGQQTSSIRPSSSVLRRASSFILHPSSFVFIPLLLGFAVNLFYTFHPMRYERLLLFAAPAFYLLVASGVNTVFNYRPRVAYAAILALAAISAMSLYDFYTVPRYEAEDYRPLIREMETVAQPQDIVLAPYPWQIGYLEAYYRGAALDILEVAGEDWITHPEKMSRELQQIRASNPRVWLLAYQVQGRQLEDQIANFFADDYVVVDDWFGNTRLEYFAQAPPPRVNEQTIDFGADVKLISFGVGDAPIAAGIEFIPAQLHWRAVSNGYSYSLRLVNGAGEKKLQQDAPIPSGDEVMRRGFFVPHDVTTGEYALRVVVYHSADGSPVAASNEGTEIELARIVVSAR